LVNRPAPQKRKTTPFRLSPTADIIYSHLSTIPGSRLLVPQLENGPTSSDRGKIIVEGRRGDVHTEFWWGNPRGKDHFKCLGVDGGDIKMDLQELG